MKRLAIPELLDTNSGSPAEIAASLSDLNRINRWFGGISTTKSLVEEVARKTGSRTLSLLEVASGGGHVPHAVARSLQSRGIRLAVTLLDREASHMTSKNGTPAVAGDAVALPFRDRSFDIVSCCLFVHHLSPAELVKFANDALRVCRTAVVINDVVRNPLHLGLVYVSLPLYRSRLTHHDAPASVRQAYTVEETQAMLRWTTATWIDVRRYFLFRMGVILWKDQA